MLKNKEKDHILKNAYIPEHILNLMIPLSKAKAFLINDYLGFVRGDVLIFIGYPLNKNFSEQNFINSLQSSIRKFNPCYVWFITPQIPSELEKLCMERETDDYYILDLEKLNIKKELIRQIKKASMYLTVRRNSEISKEHLRLIKEFIEIKKPSKRVADLFLNINDFVTYSKTAVVLDCMDKKDNLIAFYVLDVGGPDFITYVIGTYDRNNYIPHASDLAFHEMINIARQENKKYIHLGLGVNEGLRRFKEKWDGVPFLKYELCGYRITKTESTLIDSFLIR